MLLAFVGLQNLTNMYSEKIKLIRNQLGLSANALSAKIGIPVRTIVSYESGRDPSLEFAAQMCNKLDVNLNWFVSGQGEMFNTPQETTGDDFEKRLKRIETVLKDAGFNLDKNSCGL